MGNISLAANTQEFIYPAINDLSHFSNAEHLFLRNFLVFVCQI